MDRPIELDYEMEWDGNPSARKERNHTEASVTLRLESECAPR